MTEFTLTRFHDVHEALCNPSLRQSLYDAGEVIMKDVLLTLHGDIHKKRRHLELRLFHRDYARFYEQKVFPPTLQAVLAPYVKARELDLVDFGYRVTMNLTADFAGIDRPGNDAVETEKLLSITRHFSEGATIVHSDRNPEEVIEEVKEAQILFEEFLEPSWQRRKQLLDRFRNGDLEEADLPRDVLTVLLRNQDNIDIDDDVIRREIGFYLQAGSHSTANSMVHAVHELFERTDFQELRHDPLRLQRCVHESMRLHPASPVAWRTPVSPVRIAGHELAQGDRLILDIEQANRDPAIFGDNADQFDPDRTIEEPRVEAYGLTFGTGVHMCTGRDLDGGIPSARATDAETHQYGIVTKLIHELLQHGMMPHPDDTPLRDTTTVRNNWGYYPVILGEY